MILDHQLAQQIVDRTMEIIDNNINVMNQTGMIIASGDSGRIGQLHDGALLALKHGDTVEVTQGSSESLKGVKQGINLLLKNSDEVIGVVGITGSPDGIRNYANLVKMTAEMMIEQAKLTEKLQWDKRHKQEMVLSWINNQLPASRLENEARLLGVDIVSSRYAIVIKLADNQQTQSPENIKHLIDLLERADKDNLVAVISLSEIVLLKKHIKTASQSEPAIIQQLSNWLAQSGFKKIKLALGQTFTDIRDLPLSYESSKQVLQFGLDCFPNNSTYLFEHFKMALLISPIRGHWQEQQLREPYLKLIEKDTSNQLCKTLFAFFEHNGNLKSCAKSLSIHRNTLRYRLEKISTITGLSTHNFSDLTQLYLASELSRAHKKQ